MFCNLFIQEPPPPTSLSFYSDSSKKSTDCKYPLESKYFLIEWASSPHPVFVRSTPFLFSFDTFYLFGFVVALIPIWPLLTSFHPNKTKTKIFESRKRPLSKAIFEIIFLKISPQAIFKIVFVFWVRSKGQLRQRIKISIFEMKY